MATHHFIRNTFFILLLSVVTSESLHQEQEKVSPLSQNSGSISNFLRTMQLSSPLGPNHVQSVPPNNIPIPQGQDQSKASRKRRRHHSSTLKVVVDDANTLTDIFPNCNSQPIHLTLMIHNEKEWTEPDPNRLFQCKDFVRVLHLQGVSSPSSPDVIKIVKNYSTKSKLRRLEINFTLIAPPDQNPEVEIDIGQFLKELANIPTVHMYFHISSVGTSRKVKIKVVGIETVPSTIPFLEFSSDSSLIIVGGTQLPCRNYVFEKKHGRGIVTLNLCSCGLEGCLH